LHDQTGQVLTALGIGLHSAQQLVLSQPTLAQQRMNELEKMSADAIDELRQFVSELRPALLDDLGLVAALRAMAQQVTDRVGIQVKVQFDGARRRLPPQIETVLYRIAQEALNNTVRHSQAQQATVQLEFGYGVVRLVVQDNGTGFAPSAVMKSRGAERAWGLLGMQERVELVGGKFEVQSAPGQGTCLSVEIPVPIAEGVNVDSTGAC
ncbi:MAG TPA: sensor histidine kinase, partial [Anaerolineae bacterium]